MMYRISDRLRRLSIDTKTGSAGGYAVEQLQHDVAVRAEWGDAVGRADIARGRALVRRAQRSSNSR